MLFDIISDPEFVENVKYRKSPVFASTFLLIRRKVSFDCTAAISLGAF